MIGSFVFVLEHSLIDHSLATLPDLFEELVLGAFKESAFFTALHD